MALEPSGTFPSGAPARPKIERLRVHVVNIPVQGGPLPWQRRHSRGQQRHPRIGDGRRPHRLGRGVALARLHRHGRGECGGPACPSAPASAGAGPRAGRQAHGDGGQGRRRLPGGESRARSRASRYNGAGERPLGVGTGGRPPPRPGAAQFFRRQSRFRRRPRRYRPHRGGRCGHPQDQDRLRGPCLRPDAAGETACALRRYAQPAHRLQPGPPGHRRHPYAQGPGMLRAGLHRAAGEAPRARRTRGDNPRPRHARHGGRSGVRPARGAGGACRCGLPTSSRSRS